MPGKREPAVFELERPDGYEGVRVGLDAKGLRRERRYYQFKITAFANKKA